MNQIFQKRPENNEMKFVIFLPESRHKSYSGTHSDELQGKRTLVKMECK